MVPISQTSGKIKVILKFQGPDYAHNLDFAEVFGVDNHRIQFDEQCKLDHLKEIFSITIHLNVFGKWKTYHFQDLKPETDEEGRISLFLGPREASYPDDLRWAVGA